MKTVNQVILLRCPGCGAAHNLPLGAVGEEPRQVECADCGERMTLARGDSMPPRGFLGYEYSELPDEAAEEGSGLGVLRPSSIPAPRSTTMPPGPREVALPWLRSKPFVLGRRAIGRVTPAARGLGIASAAVFVALLGVIVFVGERNGWDTRIDPGTQLSRAFLGGELEPVAKAAEAIQATIDERQPWVTADGRRYLVVKGKVFNDDIVDRRSVLLRGRLLDDRGRVLSETTVPCGEPVDVARMDPSEAVDLARRDPRVAIAAAGSALEQPPTRPSCDLGRESVGAYEMMFDAPRRGVQVEVRAISAER